MDLLNSQMILGEKYQVSCGVRILALLPLRWKWVNPLMMAVHSVQWWPSKAVLHILPCTRIYVRGNHRNHAYVDMYIRLHWLWNFKIYGQRLVRFWLKENCWILWIDIMPGFWRLQNLDWNVNNHIPYVLHYNSLLNINHK